MLTLSGQFRISIDEIYSSVDQIIENFTQLGIDKVVEFYDKEDNPL